jgi:Protein of unknown function (DUF3616)
MQILHRKRILFFCVGCITASIAVGKDEPASPLKPIGTLTLQFAQQPEKQIRDDLSAVVKEGDNLWLASDETTSVERLTATSAGVFGAHQSFPLADCITLPDEKEIDIEGIARADDFLWVAGSHSLARKKPKDVLAVKTKGSNRYFLARFPVETKDGQTTLAAKSSYHDRFCAARLAGDAKGDDLTKALADDNLLAPFLSIPSKDNGLDIEGLAVVPNGADKTETLYLGLRGPVLGGWAVVIELRVDPDANDASILHLKKVNGKPYERHFLRLGGLGIRDLCADGDRLLVLTGPTMELDGPVSVYRWKPGISDEFVELGKEEEPDLRKVGDLPFGNGGNHAEGICIFSVDASTRKALVVYDTPIGDHVPSKEGKPSDVDVRADLFELQ